MSGMWGNNFKISIFGESHGEGIGATICGVPSGLEIDNDYIIAELLRRAGGHDSLSTPRLEADEFKILSGVFEGRATGSPICILIPNTNTISKDYDKIKDYMRPSHADYTAFVKYGGNNDYRGGGHFSGRITAALVAAGAIAKMYLKSKGIIVGGHILSIGEVSEQKFDVIDEELLKALASKKFAVVDDIIGIKMKEEIQKAKLEQDSIGGVVEAAVIGLPVGIGEPFFDSVESVISHLLFSIPAVKGVEFGAGFNISKMRGSVANDSIYEEDGKIYTKTNNNGGINGGITNGMPIIVRTAFKPTPSISKEQQTVDIKAMKNVHYSIHGRHDPCIVQRAVVVVESAVAIGIAELILEGKC